MKKVCLKTIFGSIKTNQQKYEKNFQIHSNLDGQYNRILFEFKKIRKYLTRHTHNYTLQFIMNGKNFI